VKLGGGVLIAATQSSQEGAIGRFSLRERGTVLRPGLLRRHHRTSSRQGRGRCLPSPPFSRETKQRTPGRGDQMEKEGTSPTLMPAATGKWVRGSVTEGRASRSTSSRPPRARA